jgi:hypothetical protein
MNDIEWTAVNELPAELREVSFIGRPKKGYKAKWGAARADPDFPNQWTATRVQDLLVECFWPTNGRRLAEQGYSDRLALACYFLGLRPKTLFPPGDTKQVGVYSTLVFTNRQGQALMLRLGRGMDGGMLQPYLPSALARQFPPDTRGQDPAPSEV